MQVFESTKLSISNEEKNICPKQIIHFTPEYDIYLLYSDETHFLNSEYTDECPQFISYFKAFLKNKDTDKIVGCCSFINIKYTEFGINDIRQLLPYFSLNYIIPLKELPLYLFRSNKEIKLIDDFYLDEEYRHTDLGKQFIQTCIYGKMHDFSGCVGVAPVYYNMGKSYLHINQDKYLRTNLKAEGQTVRNAITNLKVQVEYKRMSDFYDRYLDKADKTICISKMFHSLWSYDKKLHKRKKELNDYSFSEIIKMN